MKASEARSKLQEVMARFREAFPNQVLRAENDGGGFVRGLGVGLTREPQSIKKKERAYQLAVRITDRTIDQETVRDTLRSVLGVDNLAEAADLRTIIQKPNHFGLLLEANRTPQDVMRPGLSIGPTRGPKAASISCLVQQKDNPKALGVLTAAHGVLPEHTLDPERDQAIQPAGEDGGRFPTHAIGHVRYAATLLEPRAPTMDIAVVELDEDTAGLHRDQQQERPVKTRKLTGVCTADEIEELARTGLPDHREAKATLYKNGRTTGEKRRAFLSGFGFHNYPIAFNLHGQPSYLETRSVLEITSTSNIPFAEQGDSGALVCTHSGKAIGIIFYGEYKHSVDSRPPVTLAVPMHAVVEVLDGWGWELVLES